MAGPLTTVPAHLVGQRRGGPVAPGAFPEYGVTGLRQYGGFVLEEWLANLQGRNEPWAYREMIDNDPVIGGIMFAIKMMARKARWWVAAPEGKGASAEAAEFVESCIHDMSQTWIDFLSEALSFAGYGWSWHEICYKRREGPKADTWSAEQLSVGYVSPYGEAEEDWESQPSSKYKDGKIGWRKLPIRSQDTLLRFHFDGEAGVEAFEQIDWHGGMHVIPIQKSLLFRTETTKNNPQGRSLFRNCWVPFYAKKNIEAIEQIGIERELAGIPVAIPPDNIDIFAPQNVELLAEVQKLVTSLRRDEYEGIVLPSQWKLELLKTGGQRQIDTNEVIRRYDQRIAASLLADFILVGLDATGSYAMVDVKSELFGVAMDTILDLVAEVFNRYAIPRLLALNGMDSTDPPVLKHSSAARFDLEKVGNFFREISTAGAPIPWSKEMVAMMIEESGLPTAFAGMALETREHPEGAVHTLGAQPRQEPLPPAGRETTKAEGHELDVTGTLRERHAALSQQLEGEMLAALSVVADEAGNAYRMHAEKAMSRAALGRIVARVLRATNIRRWIRTRLQPLLDNHAARVTAEDRKSVV